MDKKSIKELIAFIEQSINLIEERFIYINQIDDFTDTKEGLEKLDSISMRLQAIGEAIKNILKREESFLLQFANKEYWSQIVRFRDVISHHYIDIDSEIVYDICSDDLIELKNYIIKAKKQLEK